MIFNLLKIGYRLTKAVALIILVDCNSLLRLAAYTFLSYVVPYIRKTVMAVNRYCLVLLDKQLLYKQHKAT